MHNHSLTERDLRALRIFRVTAQAGGFSAAEQMLHMSKATISRQIKMVEERLGTQLCLRGPRGFELTAAGYTALRYAKEALDALDRIFPEVDATRGIISGRLAVGLADNALGNPGGHVAEALSRLCRTAPDIELTLSTMTSDQLNKALAEGQVDVAIKGVHADHRMHGFTYVELFEEPHRIYGPACAFTGSGAPAHLPLVYRSAQPFVTHALSHLGFARGPEATGIESVAMLVASGHFMGILPVHYARMLGPDIDLREVPETPTYGVWQCAMINASRKLSRAASRLLDLLVQTHGEMARQVNTEPVDRQTGIVPRPKLSTLVGNKSAL